MPLLSGTSRKTIQTNIREMIAAGHSPAQAEAAAYSKAGKEQGPALLVMAIGVNSIAISRDVKLDPEDGIGLLELETETIAKLLRELKARKKNAWSDCQANTMSTAIPTCV